MMKFFGIYILTNRSFLAKMDAVRTEANALSARLISRTLSNFEDLRQSYVALKRSHRSCKRANEQKAKK